MAVRYAVVNGNWSAVGTWDGGASLPDVGDDVYANGYTITMNITPITVTKLSTEVCPITSVGGGRFEGSATANTIIGNIVAGSTICVYFTASTGFVIGNVYGGSSINAYGIRCQNYGGVTVTGNIYGGSAANAHGIYTYYGYDITIVGNVEGGSVSTARGIEGKLATGGKILSITGVVEGKTANAVSIDNSGWEIRIVGTLKSNTGLAIYGSAPSDRLLQITGNLISSANSIPFVGYYNVKLTADSSSVFKMYDTDGTEVYYYTSDAFNPPAESDVREGVEYGSGFYEGTLIVPPPESVVKGVPVDNTVGTWAFDTELITRLQNCSTVPITGQQIASYNGAPAELVPYNEKRTDYVSGTPDILYLGTAPVGTLDSSTVWNLTKLELAVDGSITSETHATDSWDNHLTAIYS